jgi:hypothetical protein
MQPRSPEPFAASAPPTPSSLTSTTSSKQRKQPRGWLRRARVEPGRAERPRVEMAFTITNGPFGDACFGG